MKRFLDILRFTLISFEFLWVLLLMLIAYSFPDFLAIIGKKLVQNEDVLKWLPTLPLLFAGVTFKLSGRVRAPLEKGNKQLFEWSQFNRITDRLYAAYLLVILSSLAALSIWIFSSELTSTLIGLIFLSSVGVSGFVAFQIFLAAQKIKELLECHGEGF